MKKLNSLANLLDRVADISIYVKREYMKTKFSPIKP